MARLSRIATKEQLAEVINDAFNEWYFEGDDDEQDPVELITDAVFELLTELDTSDLSETEEPETSVLGDPSLDGVDGNG